MRTEFQLGKMERVLELDGGDGLRNNENVLDATELYTYKELRW